ncbi:MAG: LptF/LptG family permease [Spirochaetota bacterium]
MNTLERHLLREFFLMFLGTVVFFSIIVTFSEMLSQMQFYLALVKMGPKLAANIPKFHLLRIPYIITGYLTPVCIMFAATFVLGTMVKNNEMMSVYGSGISLSRFIRVLIIASIVICGTSIIVWEFIAAPWVQESQRVSDEMYNRPRRLGNNDNLMLYGRGNRVIFIRSYSIPEKRMQGGLIITTGAGNIMQEKLTFREGTWVAASNAWLLTGGAHTVFVSNRVAGVTVFSNFMHAMPETPVHFEKPETSPELMTLAQSLRYIEKLKDVHGDTSEAETKMHLRLAITFISIIIILISAAFARFSSQSVLVVSFALVIGFVLAFYLVMSISTSLSNMRILPPIVGAWLPDILFLGIAIYLFRRIQSNSPSGR